MAVKLGKAMGLEVTVFSTSPNKEAEAREVLGADHFVVSKDVKQMKVNGFVPFAEHAACWAWRHCVIATCRIYTAPQALHRLLNLTVCTLTGRTPLSGTAALLPGSSTLWCSAPPVNCAGGCGHPGRHHRYGERPALGWRLPGAPQHQRPPHPGKHLQFAMHIERQLEHVRQQGSGLGQGELASRQLRTDSGQSC